MITGQYFKNKLGGIYVKLKGKMSIVLASLVLTTSLMMPEQASAASTRGAIDGKEVLGSLSLGTNNATALTRMSGAPGAYLSVSVNYKYRAGLISITREADDSDYGSSQPQYQATAKAEYTGPESISASSVHFAQFNAGTWTDSLSIN